VKFAAQGNAPATPQPFAVPAAPPKPDSGWSVFVGEQLPPLSATPVPEGPVTPAAAPPSIPAVQFSSSLRRPVFNLLLTNALEIATAVATGTPSIDPMIVVRGAVTVVTLLAGMISGRKRGSASKMVLFGSLGLCAIQAFGFWDSVNSIMAAPGATERLLPHTVTQGLALLTGVRTAWRARK
jgi:hypothetical protein